MGRPWKSANHYLKQRCWGNFPGREIGLSSGRSGLLPVLRSLTSFAIALFLISGALHLPSSPTAAVPSPPAVDLLPSPKPHPLPTTLEAWQDNASGDYFDQIKPVIVGYLVWTQFPITIYIDPATATEQAKPFLAKRAQTWIVAVQKAIQEWQPYLPLKIVNQATGADIIIRRSTPPLRLAAPAQKTNDSNPNRPRFEIPRARSAETQFELYARRSPTQSPETPALLAHRVTIHIRPDQAADYLQAAARHELGHALGIWGHSTQPTDALYFSQVRNPATISNRDLNTLKRIYTQPTRLGWPLMARSQEHRQ